MQIYFKFYEIDFQDALIEKKLSPERSRYVQ